MFDLDSVEFDHVFTVTDDGRVIDGPADLYAPDVFDGEVQSTRWQFWSNGYSGQDSYAGPIMHNSEHFGQSRMARDLLSEPGTYAVVVAYWDESLTADDIPEDFPVRPVDYSDAAGIATCGSCGLSWDDTIPTAYTPAPAARCPFEAFHAAENPYAEGWAVVKYTGDDGA